jgi:hypothetical protein
MLDHQIRGLYQQEWIIYVMRYEEKVTGINDKERTTKEPSSFFTSVGKEITKWSHSIFLLP